MGNRRTRVIGEIFETHNIETKQMNILSIIVVLVSTPFVDYRALIYNIYYSSSRVENILR